MSHWSLKMLVNFARACNQGDRIDACHLSEAFVPGDGFPGKSECLSFIGSASKLASGAYPDKEDMVWLALWLINALRGSHMEVRSDTITV